MSSLSAPAATTTGSLLPLPPNHKFHGFLTHTWMKDELGRPNHNRVTKVFEGLKRLGLSNWFDGEKMQDDVMMQMINGIDQSACIVVFITKKYIEKVGSGNRSDNCFKEFDFAYRKKPDCMIAVPMEPCCLNPGDWSGPVSMALGGMLYEANFANDDGTFDENVKKLYQQILRKSGLAVSSPSKVGDAELRTRIEKEMRQKLEQEMKAEVIRKMNIMRVQIEQEMEQKVHDKDQEIQKERNQLKKLKLAMESKLKNIQAGASTAETTSLQNQLRKAQTEIDTLTQHVDLLTETLGATKNLLHCKTQEVSECEYQWAVAKAKLAQCESDQMEHEADVVHVLEPIVSQIKRMVSLLRFFLVRFEVVVLPVLVTS